MGKRLFHIHPHWTKKKMTSEDAIEFLMAGATAIEIGTANFIDPTVTVKVRDGINDWLDRHGCKSVAEIIGALR